MDLTVRTWLFLLVIFLPGPAPGDQKTVEYIVHLRDGRTIHSPERPLEGFGQMMIRTADGGSEFVSRADVDRVEEKKVTVPSEKELWAALDVALELVPMTWENAKVILKPTGKGSLVLVSATWCKPCQFMKRQLGQIPKGRRRVTMYLYETSGSEPLPDYFRPLGVSPVGRVFPQLLFIQEGKIMEVIRGYDPGEVRRLVQTMEDIPTPAAAR